jgi:cell shape-determining protein MreC
MSQGKKNFLLILVIFVLVILLLFFRSLNNNLNYSMQRSQIILNSLLEENKTFRLRVENSDDLREVSRIAKEELGMIFPKKIEYIYE